MALLSAPSDPESEEQEKHRFGRPLSAERPALGRHVPALDGVRAVAVAAVLAFHFGAGFARGGLLGVDIFFVLSGFLITSLLLDEHARSGTIRLRAFWGRRARRLLPALLLVIATVTITARWLGDQGDLRLLRDDALSTLAYVANWHFAASGQDYFGELAADSPLLHTWSLGIEEQFYLLWPLLAVLLLRLRRGEVWLRVVAVVGTVASTVWLIYLATGGADTSRLYYGTDTRVAALLVGAVVATMRPGLLVPKAPPAPEVPEEGAVLPPPPGASRRWSVRLVHGAGLAGAALLVVEIFVVRGEDPILYRGGFLVVALAAAALIAAAVALPRSRLARVLSVAPLRLLGRISYGVYLWHWPVQLAVTHVRTHLSGPVLFLARLGVTLLLATLSYQLVELPVRRRRWAVSWPRRSAALVAVSATLVAIVLGTSLAVPQQQSQSSILSESRIGTSGQVPTASPAAAPEPAIPARSLTADSTAPRAPLGHPLRVMLTGDSIAATLGWNLGPLLTQTNTQLYLDAPLGCGLVLGKHNDRGRIIADPSDCASWPQRWSNEVRQYTPDVVAVLVGRWEMTDRFYAGAWRHLGDPVFDDYVRAQLERAVQVGGSRGAQVALLNPPCLQDVERPDGGAWPQNDPARAQRFADLQKEVVARHPKNVEILDLAGLICPGGKFARVIGGVQVRDRDGVHFTVSGARFVGRSLLPALQSIAEEAQFRRVLQVLAQRGISSSS